MHLHNKYVNMQLVHQLRARLSGPMIEIIFSKIHTQMSFFQNYLIFKFNRILH